MFQKQNGWWCWWDLFNPNIGFRFWPPFDALTILKLRYRNHPRNQFFDIFVDQSFWAFGHPPKMEHNGTILIWKSCALVSNHPPRLRCAWMFQCDKIEDLERWICWRWHWLETNHPFLLKNAGCPGITQIHQSYCTFQFVSYFIFLEHVLSDCRFCRFFQPTVSICFCPASMIKLRRGDLLAPSHHMHFWFQRVMEKEGYRNAKKIQKERNMTWYYFTKILLLYLFGGCCELRFFTTILGTWC